MKYFIAFLLLFFAPNFALNTAFAVTNSTHVALHSTISPYKKLTFKEKLLLKLSKKEVEKLSKFQRILLIGVLLIVVGVILMVVGDNKAKAAPKGGFVPSFDGVGETILGFGAAFLGLLVVLVDIIVAKTSKPKPTS
jgi:hypothetical protein